MSSRLGIVMTDRRIVAGWKGAIKFNTASVVVRSEGTKKLVGVGFCSGYDLIDSYPVKDGVVCDFEGASFMVNEYIKYNYSWFSRLYLKVNFAMRGMLSESEVRSLKACFPNRRNKAFYMQEIIASVIGLKEGVVIYVADDFIEIALMKDSRIERLFAKKRALEELRNSIMDYIDEHKIMIGAVTLRLIIRHLFHGEAGTIHGPNKITRKPESLELTCKEYNKLSSSWLNNVAELIVDFLKKYNVDDRTSKIYLMSDFDNVEFLTEKLSSRCDVRIRPINNALEKIAINLSQRR